MKIDRKLHGGVKERDENDVKCLACMKHRIEWLAKQGKVMVKYQT